ncbi:hypothetical protein JF535_04780 [Microbulbifer salipaludis]|uniref:Uncharacterized protein n=1 Tax=Microbulbifer salipaludis TaxID=187980 RepID=A0ABS3E4E2_9GAMM|nr:hypothetical protein [Microbulbifer salipaludis]MBN8430165.1 hypothetical protein [Microbulbifer salipaludis]
MNKLLKIVLGVVGVVALAISAVFYLTSGMVKVADELFLAASRGDTEKAYSLLSDDFKSGTSQEDLKKYFIANSLNNFKEASWESRSTSGGRGSLKGSITTREGGVIPITLNFVKSDSDWKIYSIQKPSSGLQVESELQMPSENEQLNLVTNSMQVFAESVNEKSMKKFHSTFSSMFKMQFTPEKLDEAYGSFYQAGVDLTVLENIEPKINSSAAIDDNGVLVISGYYPTEPSQVKFTQKFAYEGLNWKLIGFNINIE